jgi:cytochrome c553
MYDMKTGARNGVWTPLMMKVVSQLSDDDMLALAAYAASLKP